MNLHQSTRELVILALGWAYSQKQANIVEWIRYGVRIEKSGLSSNLNIIVDGIEVGHILASIGTLRNYEQAWTRYCYGPENLDGHRSAIAWWVLGKLRFRNHNRHQAKAGLCHAVVDDCRLRLSSARQLPIEAYFHSMGLDPEKRSTITHWSRDWETFKEVGIDEVMRMDSEVIGNLSRTIKYLRGTDSTDFDPPYRTVLEKEESKTNTCNRRNFG